MQLTMTMDDRTARTITRHGGPRGECEYAIHQAHGQYKRTTAAADAACEAAGETEAAHRVRVTETQQAWRARHGAVTGALAGWDAANEAGDPDGLVIETARMFIRSLPAELKEW